jgi:hypothetical protein
LGIFGGCNEIVRRRAEGISGERGGGELCAGRRAARKRCKYREVAV